MLDRIVDNIVQFKKLTKAKGELEVYSDYRILAMVDEDHSTLYTMEQTDPTQITLANTFTNLSNGIFDIDQHTLNMINAVMIKYLTNDTNYEKIIRPVDTPYPIPSKASDNCRFTRYYYENDPSKNITIGEFYNMIPVNKGDTYDMFVRRCPHMENTLILRTVVHKKKPRVDFNITRLIMELK